MSSGVWARDIGEQYCANDSSGVRLVIVGKLLVSADSHEDLKVKIAKLSIAEEVVEVGKASTTMAAMIAIFDEYKKDVKTARKAMILFKKNLEGNLIHAFDADHLTKFGQKFIFRSAGVRASPFEGEPIKPSDIFPSNKELSLKDLMSGLHDYVNKADFNLKNELLTLADAIHLKTDALSRKIDVNKAMPLQKDAGEFLGVMALLSGTLRCSFETAAFIEDHLKLSTKNLHKARVIFPDAKNAKLIDSIIRSDHGELLISSKAARKGGAAPSLASLGDNLALTNKKTPELDFIRTMIDPEISMYDQPFLALQLLRKRYPSISKDYDLESEDLDILKNAMMNNTALNSRLKKFLSLYTAKDTTNPKYRHGFHASASMATIVCNLINSKRALPNFSKTVKELLSDRFVQIYSRITTKEATYEAICPNNYDGDVHLWTCAASTRIDSKLKFKII